MNITINLITNLQETVPNTVLTKILTVKRNGGIVNLTGNIYIPAAYVNEVLEFCTYFGLTEDENTPGTYRGNDIILSVGTSYISFEDNEVARIINGFGSDGHTTLQLARNAVFTSSTFQNNTVILTFPEFDLFTKANTNPPNDLFKGCTNLTSINLLNASTISQNEFYGSGITTVYAPNITTIGLYAFSGCESLTEVSNLGSITSLSDGCFRNSDNLKSVVLPDSCISIGNLVFRGSNFNISPSLESINLGNITFIGSEAFTNCQVLDINVQDLQNLISIGNDGFHACYSLYGELYLPNLISLGISGFRACPKITKVKCLGKILSIPNGCFLKHPSTTSLNLSEVYLPYECISIGSLAFADCTNLTTLKLYTDSVDNWVEGETPTYGDITRVTSFGNGCFKNCSLLQLSASALTNATTIGTSAFNGCKLLTGELNFPNLTSLEQNAFSYTGITSIVDLGSITTIPRECFRGCTSLTNITLPSTVTSIELLGFADCHMTTMDLSHVTSIGEEAFVNSYLTTTTDLSNVISIGPSAFRGSRLLGALNMPNLISLGNSAFQYTNITSVLNLGTITRVDDSTFENCTNLTKIILPTTVTSLGSNWYYTSSFKNMWIQGLDNVNTRDRYARDTLSNMYIINPIKLSVTSGNGFILNGNYSGKVLVHSMYLPKMTSTSESSENYSYTFFTNRGGYRNEYVKIGLLYFEDILSFGNATFKNAYIDNLVINNTTPPSYTSTNSDGDTTYSNLTNENTVTGNGAGYIGIIWVPDNAVATYLANALYSNYTIKGINTKTNGIDYDLPRYTTFAAWEIAEEAAVAQGEHAPQGLIEAWCNITSS